MKGFTLLWSKILDSSIWMESKETRLVWVTMLAMKDENGIITASPKALAHRARVTEEECAEALRLFTSPDADSGSDTDEGRRIRVVPGGWQLINHEKYRFSTEAKREAWRLDKEQRRAAADKPKTKAGRKKKATSSGPVPGETSADQAYKNGDIKTFNRIVDQSLPERCHNAESNEEVL